MNADVIAMVKALSSDMPLYEFERAKLEIIEAIQNLKPCSKCYAD